MSLVKRNQFRSSFPVFFDDFFNRDVFQWGLTNSSSTNTTIPAVNIMENKDGFMIEVAAPGMDKKDFQVKLDENVLTISSEKQESREEKNDEKTDEHYTRREFSYQSFSRSFTLKKDLIDTEKIEAKYEAGVLRLSLPKKESARQEQKRLIEVA
jgi:HSP20 family protein